MRSPFVVCARCQMPAAFRAEKLLRLGPDEWRIMKMLTIAILAITAVAGLPVNLAARVGSISFEDLVKRSDYIVVGEVVAVDNVEQIKVAKVHVTRTLKGSPTQDVYFLASPTWTCDITSAEVGEKALFFFTKNQSATNPKTQPFFQIAHSGRGKMPLRQIEGIDFVTSWSDVRLPKEINTVAGPEPKYEFIRSAPLEQIIEYVERILSQPKYPIKSR